jgi:DNA adenine methylase
LHALEAQDRAATRASAPVRTPLRWAGSKRILLPELVSRVPAGNGRYVEPFAGSACLYFATQPESAMLADFNIELIDTLEAIKTNPVELHRAFSALPNDSETYYAVRRSQAPTKFDSAVRFYYLNRYSFNAVYRTNKQGRFNVPRGSNTGNPPSLEQLLNASRVLRTADLLAQDFRVTLSACLPNDFVYIDPPYLAPTRKTYGEYGYGSFGKKDAADLTELMSQLTRQGTRVLFSFGSVEGFESLLSSWHVTRVSPRRSVAASPGKRTPSLTEIIADNYGLLDTP